MKTASDVNALLAQLSDRETCYNGTVIFIINKQRNMLKGKQKPIPYTSVVESLWEQYSPPGSARANADFVYNLKPRANRLYEQYKKLTKSVSRNWEKIVVFLETVFPLDYYNVNVNDPCSILSNQEENQVGISEIGLNGTSDSQSFGAATAALITPVLSPLKTPDKTPVLSPVKTRRDCLNCSSAKKINFSLNDSLKKQRSAVWDLKLSRAQLKKEWNVKAKAQKIKRNEETIKELKQKLRKNDINLKYQMKKNLSSAKEINSLKKENSKLLSENEKLKSANLKLKEDLKVKTKVIIDSDKYSDFLESIVEDKAIKDTDDKVVSKSGRNYSDRIRRCVYNELIFDVPVKNCGVLIKLILEILLAGKSIDNIPSPATCSQMAFELEVLATLQTMDFMLQQQSLCLSWDATTIEGAHINEIHVTANKMNYMVLDVRHIPGGKSSDYVSHIIGALTEAASTYAKFSNCSESDILSSLKSRIASTLTDRAAVNGAVTRQLCHELDSELLLLNCNIHPLDSVARDVKAAFMKLDSAHGIQGQCYGTEGAGANLIKAISILRYKDGKGDPIGFKNFLRQQNTPMSAFPRYVGNRLHVLFHLAGVLILHETQLREFVEKQCTAAGLLRSRILNDLKDMRIMSQVWLLAAIGKTISGPWMTRFYSSTMSNLEMGPFIRRCVTQLKSWIEDPHSFLCLNFDVFTDKLDSAEDKVLAALHEFYMDRSESEMSLLLKFSDPILSSVLSVISRQLLNFLDGDYVHPSAQMMERTASAPTHNMASERTLGSYDRMLRRAPIATMGFLNGKVKTKFNKTMQWLDQKPDGERIALINFAIQEARQGRYKQLLQSQELATEISKRRSEVAFQREKTKKNHIVRDLNKVFNKRQPINSLPYSDESIKCILNYVDSPESVIGMLFIHMIEGVQKYGRVQRVKKNNKLVVAYWGLEEVESNSSDCSVSASSFYADLILGHVILM